jgi:hypothetical protein
MLREEDQPNRLSDYLPQADPAAQQHWRNEFEASYPTPLNTPLSAGDGVENGNARAQRSLVHQTSAHMRNLQLGTQPEDYSEGEASGAAPGEETTATRQANLTTTPGRNRRAIRRVGPLRRMNAEETEVFSASSAILETIESLLNCY